jgi:hypothetical protein
MVNRRSDYEFLPPTSIDYDRGPIGLCLSGVPSPGSPKGDRNQDRDGGGGRLVPNQSDALRRQLGWHLPARKGRVAQIAPVS